jgi:hypothetical protein
MPDRKTKKAPTRRARKGGRSNPMTGSYFLSLEVENVRCFSERQTLDLRDGRDRPAQWTILLGENGTGKTTILQLLAIMSVSEPVLDRDTPRPRSRQLSRAFDMMRDSLIRNAAEPTRKIRYRIAHGAVLSDEGARFDRGSYAINMSPGGFLHEPVEPPGSPAPQPTCFAYSVDRRLNPVPSLQRPPFVDSADGLFLETSSTGDAEGWLLRLDYVSSKVSRMQGRQKRMLGMVEDVLVEILPGVSGIRFDPSSGFNPRPKAEFKTPDGWVPLWQLGYGYRAMIAWVVDLAARMIECYPDSPDPLAGPAVVLVDEIDLHLHPKWQRRIIGYLTERFPNTQFIITSHSPLVVQAAPDANLALLKREGDHVVIENDPETIRGWRVDQILTSDLFGLPTARPPDEEKLLLRRKELLSKARLAKADRKELGEINDRLGPIPPGESFDEARKTMDLIERSLKLIEKYQGTTT